MTVEKKTNYGNISVSEEALASLAGGVITECYGVVGMASKKVLRDGWSEILKKDNYAKGVVVRTTDKGIEIDLYIIVSFGVKISPLDVVPENFKTVDTICALIERLRAGSLAGNELRCAALASHEAVMATRHFERLRLRT